MPAFKILSLVVSEPGMRLDRYLAEKYPELSRTQAQKLVAGGLVTVNDQVAKSGLKLNTGDRLRVKLPPPPNASLSPEAMPLNIVFEDSDLLVIEKPAGLTVHPAPGHPSHTLINAVLAHVPDLPPADDLKRPGVVHRLDKDASGLMVVAKNSRAQLDLISQFKARSVVKAYLVLVRGQVTPDDGVIEAPIGRDPRHRKRMAVVAQGEGREARTQYHVVRHIGEATLLEVKPETGRTHQIRVHLSAIGYPVVGDKVYGSRADKLPRLFLHACRLGFKLPSTGEYQEFTSSLPPDLELVLAELG
ncbi:MAG: RluA family pseudouridine synthase [Dehalococcoidales bacterium]|nr:RluA family pseudouridine synthase [Dehalococcoidales bacterium]